MERQCARVCHVGNASIAAPSHVTHVHKEHLHKQRRHHCGDSNVLRGKNAVASMMTELQTFYSEHVKLHEYNSLAASISREARDFKHAPADVAVPEPHHAGLTGRGMLIEFCTSPDSMLGKVGKDLGVQVIRCTETHMNVEHDATMDILIKVIESNPGVDLSPWSQW